MEHIFERLFIYSTIHSPLTDVFASRTVGMEFEPPEGASSPSARLPFRTSNPDAAFHFCRDEYRYAWLVGQLREKRWEWDLNP